jgi:hypothetical protein
MTIIYLHNFFLVFFGRNWFFKSKTLLVFLLIVVSHPALKAQSTQDLDARNGFKTIKIGSDFNLYQNKCKFLNIDKETGGSWYNYTPTDADLYNVLNFQMSVILLEFKRGTLISIWLIRSVNGEGHFLNCGNVVTDLDKKFVDLFGPASDYVYDDSGLLRWFELHGHKILLG